jgi:hypothetical protein
MDSSQCSVYRLDLCCVNLLGQLELGTHEVPKAALVVLEQLQEHEECRIRAGLGPGPPSQQFVQHGLAVVWHDSLLSLQRFAAAAAASSVALVIRAPP